jgi:predicted Zn-dependent protease
VWQVRTFSKAHRDGPLRSHERLASSHSKKAIEQCDVMPPSAFMDTLAMLLSQKNDYVRALEWQQKAVALQPESLVYRLNLAKIYIKGGKKDLARKELDALAARGDKFSAQAEVTSLLKNL